jgi:DNA-binding transcriptional ArsR family regulator
MNEIQAKQQLTRNQLVTYIIAPMAQLSQQRITSGQRDTIFRALADPTRRRILILLSEGELPLKDIEQGFGMTRTAVIKHLSVLKSCKLVQARRKGRQNIHRLNPGPLRVVRDWVSQFEALWDDHLNRLKRQVEADL